MSNFRASRGLLTTLFLVTLVVVTVALSSCGGGTVGTSATRPSRISGTVVNQEGEALPGSSVIVLETGDGAESDETGAFSFETVLPVGSNGAPKILVSSGNIEQIVALDQLALTESGGSVVVDFVVNELLGAVEILSIEVTALPEEGALPTPTPVETPSAPSPTPQGSPTPNDPGSPTPQTRPSIIRGTIVDYNGAGLPGVSVVVSQGRRELGRSVSESTGTFSLNRRVRTVPLTLSFIVAKKDGSGDRELGRVTLTVSSTPVIIDVNLRLTPPVVSPGPGGEIEGQNDPLLTGMLMVESATVRKRR